MKFRELRFKKEGLSEETLQRLDEFVQALKKEFPHLSIQAEVGVGRDKVVIKVSATEKP